MRDRFVDVVTKLLDHHDHLALVLADISSGRFIESGAATAHPKRVINVGYESSCRSEWPRVWRWKD